MDVALRIVGTLAVAFLYYRCLYLTWECKKLTHECGQLRDVMNRANVALANELAKNLIPADYPKPVSGCNDPERLCG